MAEETNQDENIKTSESTIARLQQKVLGHGSRCPVLLRLGRMEFLPVSSWLSVYDAPAPQEHTVE